VKGRKSAVRRAPADGWVTFVALSVGDRALQGAITVVGSKTEFWRRFGIGAKKSSIVNEGARAILEQNWTGGRFQRVGVISSHAILGGLHHQYVRA
jgi:hypothetical protein